LLFGVVIFVHALINPGENLQGEGVGQVFQVPSYTWEDSCGRTMPETARGLMIHLLE
jgi:hypothetical protein